MSGRVLPALLAVALLLAAGGLIACGSEPESDSEQILSVLDSYHVATATHDAALLCADVMANPPSNSLEECTDYVSGEMQDPRSDISRSDVLVPVGEPVIEGDLASLHVKDDDSRYIASFLRGPSGWRLVLTH